MRWTGSARQAAHQVVEPALLCVGQFLKLEPGGEGCVEPVRDGPDDATVGPQRVFARNANLQRDLGGDHDLEREVHAQPSEADVDASCGAGLPCGGDAELDHQVAFGALMSAPAGWGVGVLRTGLWIGECTGTGM